MPYTSRQDVVDKLRPGWRITGQAPYMAPNPDAGRLGQPATIAQVGSTVLTIDNPNNPNDPPDEIVIKEVGNAETKGGVGYDVIIGPQKATPKPTPTATAATGLERLDANLQPVQPGGTAVYIRDPNAPPGTQPFRIEPGNETGDPSTWISVPHPVTGVPIGLYDPKSQKLVATIPAGSGKQPSGIFKPEDNVIDPNDPAHKRVIAIVDSGDQSIHAVSSVDGKQIVTTTNAVYVVDKDSGTSTKVQDLDPNQPASVFTLGNQAYVFDPKTKTITKGPSVDDPATVGVSTQNEFYVFFDKQGNEVGRVKNPSYRAPAPSIPAPNTVAPNIQIEDPDNPGRLKWVPNQGQLTIGEATQNLIKSLTGQTVDAAHPMTLEEAKTIIDASVSKMNTEAQQATTAAGAAQNILTGQQQGATTGAGILQNRVTNTTNLIQQGLGLAGQGASRSGNYGGGMMAAPAGFGANLVQGAQGFATELGGGQAVYDTAARMVQAADPQGTNPDRIAAMATLTQIMDRYHQATGQKFPAVVATEAAQQSQQTNGMAAPGAAPLLSPQPVASGNPAFASGGLGPVMAAQFVAPPVVAAGQPASLAAFTAPPLATNNLTNLDPRLRGLIY